MKKHIVLRQPAIFKIFACVCGLLGLLLRYAMAADGVDEKGLLDPWHPAMLGLLLLLGLSGAALLLASRQLNGPAAYQKAFPASTPAAIGCVPMLIYLVQTVIKLIEQYSFLAAVLPALAAISFLLVALCRLTEKHVPFFFHVLICVWLAMEMLSLYRAQSFDPQIHHFCFHLFACIALSMAAYQFAAFDVGRGKHGALWLWCLAAGILCLMCLDGGLFYAAGAAWVLTNLSVLTRRKKK